MEPPRVATAMDGNSEQREEVSISLLKDPGKDLSSRRHIEC